MFHGSGPLCEHFKTRWIIEVTISSDFDLGLQSGFVYAVKIEYVQKSANLKFKKIKEQERTKGG
jgi:hypothetical protein